MDKFKLSLPIVWFSLLLLALQGCTDSNRLPSPASSASVSGRTEALSREILNLFGEDQKVLNALAVARKDPNFARGFEEHKARVLQTHPNVFYDLAVCESWALEHGSPDVVRNYVEWRKSTTKRVKAIIAENGWPSRYLVGDEAAAGFFFLFGHADTSNAWRRTQLTTIREVFQKDHVNPRLYAHLCDRIESVDDRPQIYGTVMGPGNSPGSAQLYRPVIDNLQAVDKRRSEIGLPPMEADLEKYRRGATISAYMTPRTKDAKEWTLAEVYGPP